MGPMAKVSLQSRSLNDQAGHEDVVTLRVDDY
jgi:hypothetical protein